MAAGPGVRRFIQSDCSADGCPLQVMHSALFLLACGLHWSMSSSKPVDSPFLSFVFQSPRSTAMIPTVQHAHPHTSLNFSHLESLIEMDLPVVWTMCADTRTKHVVIVFLATLSVFAYSVPPTIIEISCRLSLLVPASCGFYLALLWAPLIQIGIPPPSLCLYLQKVPAPFGFEAGYSSQIPVISHRPMPTVRSSTFSRRVRADMVWEA